MADLKQQKVWFSQRIEQIMDSLYSLAVRLTRNHADAEDLVADSVAKAWSAIHSLEDKNRFKPWMFRILHNTFVSDYRKKTARPEVKLIDEDQHSDAEDVISSLLIQQPNEFLHWWANPEREFANHLLGEDIMSAIDALPDSFRVTILLVNVEGLSYDEAANVLNVPPGTVRSRMKRGRTLLQKSLWQHAKDAGLLPGGSLGEYVT